MTQNIYLKEHRQILQENDEISAAEEGFMKGYSEE